MAFEASAASVFEHPLEAGESFAARRVDLSRGRKNKNPGGVDLSSLEAGFASPFRLGPRANDPQKNPQAAPAGAAQDAGGLPSLAQMAGEAQMKAMQQAAYAGASQAARTTSSAVQEGASTITAHVKANPTSVTAMSCIGGLILAMSSFMHLLWVFHAIHPLPYVLRAYEFCFGLLIFIIDCPGRAVPESLRTWAYGLAPMKTNTNRVLFYLFIACLQGSQGIWFNTVCGWYFAAVAVFFTIVTAAAHKAQGQHSPGGERRVSLVQPSPQLH